MISTPRSKILFQRPCKSEFLFHPFNHLPGYPCLDTHSQILTYPVSPCYSIRSSKKLSIFYSKLFGNVCISLGSRRAAGGFEFDSNRLRTAVNLCFLRRTLNLAGLVEAFLLPFRALWFSQDNLDRFAFHMIFLGKNEINLWNS